MGKNFLIDTNILLEYLSSLLPTKASNYVENIINDNFNISIINRIEILGHNSSDVKQETFLNLANTFQLTKDVEIQTIEIRKSHKIKLPDAIIAATALVHDFTIVTRNIKDFEKIEGLLCINPYIIE